MLLDRLHSERSIRAHPGHDDGDGTVFLVLGEMTEEHVDRRSDASRRRWFLKMQRPVQDRHVFVGRNDVDMVGTYWCVFLDLHHPHGCAASDQLRHHTFVGRIHVGHKDKGESAA